MVSSSRPLMACAALAMAVGLVSATGQAPAVAAAPADVRVDEAAQQVELVSDDVAMVIDYHDALRITSLRLGDAEEELVPITSAQASYTFSLDSVGQVFDGQVSFGESPRNRWTSYRSANDEDWIELRLGDEQFVSGLDVSVWADGGGVVAPAAMWAEVWVDGAWQSVAGATSAPATPTAGSVNELRFITQRTDRVRLWLEKSGGATGVTEIEVVGPAQQVETLDPAHPAVSAVLPGSAPQASYTYTGDSVAQVTDGIVSYTESPRNRWTAYKSPNASDWITVDLGSIITVDELHIDFFEDAGAVRAPSSYTVDYWDGAAWAAVTGVGRVPSSPTGNTTNTVSFDPVNTSQVRLTMVHAGSYRSGVTELVAAESGTPVGSTWVGTHDLSSSPTLTVSGSSVVFSDVSYGGIVSEEWSFDVAPEGISVEIDRTFDVATNVRDQTFVGLGFHEKAFDAVQRVEDGGSLILLDANRDTNRFLSAEPLPEHPTGSWFGNTQYAIYTTDVDLVDKANDRILSIRAASSGEKGLVMHRDPNPAGERSLELDFAVAPTLSHPSGTYLPLAVFQTERFSQPSVAAEHTDSIAMTFSGDRPLAHYYDTLEIPAAMGMSSETISGMLNDLLRSSVIDLNVGMGDTDVSGMGPYETWWYAQNATALQASGDEGYLNTLKNFVRFIKNENYPIHGTGQLWAVSARNTSWYKDYFFDTYGQYVAGVASIYHLSGDDEWLLEVAPSVRDSLDWVLARDTNSNGLVESFGVGITQWDDQTQIGQESAYANIFLYKALNDWAQLEEDVFADATLAAQYRARADQISTTLNTDTTAGGFWSSTTNSYVHSRDLAGNVRGDVAHVHDNATAVSFGVADESRAEAIMDEYSSFYDSNALTLFPAQRLNYTGGENTNAFPSYLNGNVFPQMTLEMMSAYVSVGEYERATDLLAELAAQYDIDQLVYNTYNWDMSVDRRREPWFAANARPAAGLYTQLLGIRPAADHLVFGPIPHSDLDGAELSYHTQGHQFDLAIVDSDTRTVNTDQSGYPVVLQWRDLAPHTDYDVQVTNPTTGTTVVTVTATAEGELSYSSAQVGETEYSISLTP
ncbi:galactose-binding domain-containing protein [Microbacterium invictum]|uniref:F5/8 type C domain-containing protein n=2 Tax=Microbacterium invictum TaxID=515415 RepID=A0AA40SRJ5_9MICO|nr:MULTISPECIES: discoidin domain-containing protein [Microbacterium]MBB4141082.1 hypothetical protein [Microbacterium invictum]